MKFELVNERPEKDARYGSLRQALVNTLTSGQSVKVLFNGKAPNRVKRSLSANVYRVRKDLGVNGYTKYSADGLGVVAWLERADGEPERKV